MPAFLVEFTSLHAAAEFVDESYLSKSHRLKITLINPAAQEYLQSAAPARDPDTMIPSIKAPVALPGWKVLFESSRPTEGMAAEELSPGAESHLQQYLTSFARAVLERHRNAMIVQVRRINEKIEAVLGYADVIASNHNFICAAFAGPGRATLAFVPLTIDPPAAMHYADAISELISRLNGPRLRVIACPAEARPYLPLQTLGAISYVFEAIRRRLGWNG